MKIRVSLALRVVGLLFCLFFFLMLNEAVMKGSIGPTWRNVPSQGLLQILGLLFLLGAIICGIVEDLFEKHA